MKEDLKPLLDNLLNDSSFRNWATKSNKNDMAFWNSWINKNPRDIETIYAVKDIILGISFKKKTIEEERVNEKLGMVLKHINGKTGAENQIVKKNIGWSVKGIAAIAVIGLAFLVLTLGVFNTSDVMVHKTAFGETMSLTLPDGTSVVLNGNSEIRYDKDTPRDVVLKGEAYFKVKPKHTTDAKFWVNTQDLRVEVYGTQFHVNTRDEKTKVLLDEGSIKLLLNNGASKKMEPGELVSYSDGNDTVLHEKVDTTLKYALWREGTFTFNNINLKEMMKYIEHTYGLPSEFLDKSAETKILTGGIPSGNLEICLMAVQKATGTRIVQKDNTLLIFNK